MWLYFQDTPTFIGEYIPALMHGIVSQGVLIEIKFNGKLRISDVSFCKIKAKYTRIEYF